MSKLKIPTMASDSSSDECPDPFKYVPLCKTPAKNCPRKNSPRKNSPRKHLRKGSLRKINPPKSRKEKPMKMSPVKLDAKKKVWGPIDKFVVKKTDMVNNVNDELVNNVNDDVVNNVVNEMAEDNVDGMEDNAVNENMVQENNVECEADAVMEYVVDGSVQEDRVTSTSY